MSITVSTTMPDITTTGEVNAAELVAALKGMLGFTSTDITVPALNAIHVAADGDTLTLTATDRYTAGRWTLKYEGEPFATLLPRDNVAPILATLKGIKGTFPARLMLAGTTLTVSTITGLSTVVGTDDAAGFPNLSSVWPDKSKAGLPDGCVAVNPALLARFAKVATHKSMPMRLTMIDPRKPILVEIEDHFTGLIMPMRIA